VFNKRNRTPSGQIAHGLYLYFLGLSTRSVAKALSFLHIVRRSHVAVWKWIQKYQPRQISTKRKRVAEFIIDQTMIKAGSEYMWLWAAVEPKYRRILALTLSKERNMFVAEMFILGLTRTHGKHPVSTDGGTWYPQACRFLDLEHHIHSPLEKSLIERTMQHIKDRTECFDDYFPCNRNRGCNFLHIKNWLRLFATMHNKEVLNA
jgi:putative transposase